MLSPFYAGDGRELRLHLLQFAQVCGPHLPWPASGLAVVPHPKPLAHPPQRYRGPLPQPLRQRRLPPVTLRPRRRSPATSPSQANPASNSSSAVRSPCSRFPPPLWLMYLREPDDGGLHLEAQLFTGSLNKKNKLSAFSPGLTCIR
jgi:hypothetical protein